MSDLFAAANAGAQIASADYAGPRVQRADEYRRPISPVVEVIDTSNMNTVVSKVTVNAPHHKPGGYGDEAPPPEAPPGYTPQPPPPGTVDPIAAFPTAALDAPAVPAEEFFTPAVDAPPPLLEIGTVAPAVAAQPVVPPAQVSLFDQFKTEVQKVAARLPENKISAEWEVRVGGESEMFPAEYAEILVQEDLMVFVASDGDRLWLPKSSQSAEIAVKVGNLVFVVIVLPIKFTFDGNQFRMAMIQKSVQI